MKTKLSLMTFVVCWMPCLAVAQLDKPLVAVPAFVDRTGDHATRVAPGTYREKNVKVGSDRSLERSEKDGKYSEKESERDVYDKQLERDIEFAPGDWKLPTQASLVAADAISSALQTSGKFRILDRTTGGMKAVGNERVFAATSGGNDDLIKVCREKNAQFLVVGSVSSFRIDKREGVAYGVTRRLFSTRVNMDLRVIDVASTEVVYQASPTKTVNVQLPEGITEFTEVYDWESVLRTAVAEAGAEMTAKLAQSTGVEPQAESTVKVTLSTTPAGADILIDGDFAGNTPSELAVPARRFRLKLQRQGYQPWENEVMPREGMSISPALELLPKPPAPPANP
jgi:curli biogenesis system outer membrane secretion channel CsgG